MSYVKRTGDLRGRVASDLPSWCDLSLEAHGDPAKAQGTEVHAVWRGRQTGLFFYE